MAPPDFLACANLGDSGYCRSYVSHKKQIIDDNLNLYIAASGKQYTWSELVRISVIVPPDQFVKEKNFFDNYCHRSGGCPKGMGDWQGFSKEIQSHLKEGL